MTAPDLAAVERLASAAGLAPVKELVPLVGGANNRVFRVETTSDSALLKAYFRHPDDPRDRLGAEFAFARFAWSAGVRCIPQPLASDPAPGLGMFEFIDASPIAAVTEDSIEQATEFVQALNAARWRPGAARLPNASEACFSIAEHVGTVARRVDRLAEQAYGEAGAFARRELLPAWEHIRTATSDSGLSLDKPLEPTTRCVSPSDFGFHNALVQPDGRVCFLDFEYAGWDDPAKLVCDFFCQPAVPVPPRFFEPFAGSVAAGFPDPAAVLARARLLLPVYRVKWVCILLNEFLPAGNRRRAFSLSPDEFARRETRQLARARDALAAIQHPERISA
jgi:hypothetical protein